MNSPASAADLTGLVAAELPVTNNAHGPWKVRREPPPRPLSSDSTWTLRSPDGPIIGLSFRDWPHGRRGRLRITLELPADLAKYHGDDPTLPRPEFTPGATPQEIAAKIRALLLPKWDHMHEVARARKAESDAYKGACQAVSTALVAEFGDDLAPEQDWSYIGLRSGNGLIDGKVFIRSPDDIVVHLSLDNPDIAIALARTLATALSSPDSGNATSAAHTTS